MQRSLVAAALLLLGAVPLHAQEAGTRNSSSPVLDADEYVLMGAAVAGTRASR